MFREYRQPPVCPGGNYYTVQPGDRIEEIARLYEIPLYAIIAANPGINLMNLRPGQVLCLPLVVTPTACPEGSIPYIIRRGDTFYSIAQRIPTTVEALMEANPGVNPNTLLVGQQICIPIPRPHFR